MRCSALRVACVPALLLALASRASALEVGADFALGAARMSGDSTYTIGGTVAAYSLRAEVQWPLSELAWPLDATLLTADARLRIGDAWSVSLAAASNLGKGTGTMEDSDWGVYWLQSEGDSRFRTDSLDVFSTSDAAFDALTIDAVARRRVFERGGLAVSAGLGYLHEHFDYSASDVDQYSPSYRGYATPLREYGITADPFRGTRAGKVITYEVTYRVPYAELSGTYGFSEAFTVDARLGYSPFAGATDRDDHLLRGKVMEGDCEGSAYFAGVDARYAFAERWSLLAGVEYRSIETSGTQTQVWYRQDDPETDPPVGFRSTVDQEISSSQVVARLRLGYGF